MPSLQLFVRTTEWGSRSSQPESGRLQHAVLLAALLTAQSTFAASYDCGKASAPMEIAVCNDVELSNLDEQLATAYKSALANSAGTESEVRTVQRAWLRRARACGADGSCLSTAYRERLIVLNSSSVVSASEPLQKPPPVEAAIELANLDATTTNEFATQPAPQAIPIPPPLVQPVAPQRPAQQLAQTSPVLDGDLPSLPIGPDYFWLAVGALISVIVSLLARVIPVRQVDSSENLA